MFDQDDLIMMLNSRDHHNLRPKPTTISRQFRMSDGFYGRRSELQALRDVLTRVECGAVEIVTLSGSAGSGKTRLVQEFYQKLHRCNAFLVKGKCEPFQRNIPYAPLIAALQEVIRLILTERGERLAVWKDRLSNALGANAPLLEGLIPCLAWLLGPYPQTEVLTPQEVQTRFVNVFKDFLAALADRDHPLVIFLDDLQWVDAVTLKILYQLLTEQQSRYLLLIGAYRDQEVEAGQPLRIGAANLKALGIKITELYLQLFNVDQVAAILGETLQQPDELVRPLAEVCHRKTLGNPFFLNRFCHELAHRRLIYFNAARGSWVWRLAEIDALESSKNVVDLLVSNIKRLSTVSRRVLQVAACIGSHFQLGFLAVVLGSPLHGIEQCLAELVREELIRRLTADRPENEAGKQQYQFAHDRVQQAADYLLETEDRKLIHRQIGRLLVVGSTAPEQDDRLFEVVNHLNYALDRLADDGERLLLARLNLAAAQKAQVAAAYEEADQYLTKARQLLGAAGWEVNYGLTYQVYRHQAEIALLSGRQEESEALLHKLLARSHSDFDRVGVYDLLIQKYTLENKLVAAVRVGRAALRLLGVELPERCTTAEVERELAQLYALLGDDGFLKMAQLEVTAQLREKWVYQIMVQMISPLMFLDQQLLVYMQIRNVRMALDGAFCPEATVFFAGLGTLLGTLYGDYSLGYRLNQFALDRASQLHALALQCVISSSVANYSGWWVKPLRELEAVNTEGSMAGLGAGKVDYIGFIMGHKVCNAFYMGQDLATVSAKIDEYLPYAVKTQNTITREVLLGFRFLIANLTGMTADRFNWDYAGASETDYRDQCRTAYAYFYCHLFKAEIMYLYGELPEAGRLIGQARAAETVVTGLFAKVELVFYESLILIGLERANPETADRDRVNANLEQIRRWAENCQANFGHKQALVTAELARLDGDFCKAVDAYDRAVHLARDNGFIQDEALAAELAAGFWREAAKPDFVRFYLQQADQAYQRWGAVRKRALLAEQYPEILGNGAPSVVPSEAKWLAVQQVAQITAAVGQTPDLLQRLLTTILENSGFSQGSLTVQEGETLLVVADGRFDPSMRQYQITVRTKDVEAEQAWLPGIIRYVARTREELILPAVSAAGFIIRDEDLSQRPKSLIALPLLYRGNVRGVLYLEDCISPNAFAAERLELLRILAAQAASVVSVDPEPAGDQTPEVTAPDVLSIALTSSMATPEQGPLDRQLLRERFELLFYCNQLPQKQELYSFVGFREELPRLLVNCFGGFDLFVLVQNVAKIKWRTLKTRELVAYLMDRQGMPVAKEKLVCQLWPDLPSKRAHDLFRTTLYYCRKALQEYDLAMLIRDEKTGYSLDMTVLSCDALLVRRGLEETGAINTREKAVQIEELVALYRGVYLDESQWEWAETARMHYQQLVVAAINRLVQYYRLTGDLNKLTLYLEQLLKFDPYSNEANELLIRGYAEKGRINEAKRCYEAYCRLLQKDLGLQPEKTLQAILD
jgi:predicted ATPase/DNA-binding SARP family transcriptional activator/GAF domain-containing protein